MLDRARRKGYQARRVYPAGLVTDAEHPQTKGDYPVREYRSCFTYTFFMSRETEPRFVRQMRLADFDRVFPNEEACWTYLAVRRWLDGVVKCVRCGNDHVYASKARPWHWQCKRCGKDNRSPYRFSLKTGTIFEETKYPLLTWFKVLYLMLTSKKGISALQIHGMIGSGSYQTAWYICMRLRAGMKDSDFKQLMGIVEVDATTAAKPTFSARQ